MCAFNLYRMTYFIFIKSLLWNQVVFTKASPLLGKTKLKIVKENTIPFAAGIVYDNPTTKIEENFFCGGSLIAPKFVLTAAHCLKDELPQNIKIHVGSIDLQYGQKYAVELWISYEDWAAKTNNIPNFKRNDIAVVKLKEEVNPPIRTPILLKNPSEYYRGKTVLAVGWGPTNCNMNPRHLRKAWLNIFTMEKTKNHKWLEAESNIFASQSNPPIVSLTGDSGSPLLKQVGTSSTYIIIGILLGSGPNTLDTNDFRRIIVHLSIEPYKDFINDVIAHY